MTTRLQERIESSRAGQIVLSLFIVVTLVAIGITVMPDSLLRREASKVTDPYLKATGLEQRWRIFAPTQRPFSLRLEAQVRYDDGSIAIWRPPAGGDLIGRVLGLPLAQVVRARRQRGQAQGSLAPRRGVRGPPASATGPHAAKRDARPVQAGASPTRGAGRRSRPLAQRGHLHPRAVMKRLGAAWRHFWFEPEETSTLALVRIAFGLVVLAWTLIAHGRH